MSTADDAWAEYSKTHPHIGGLPQRAAFHEGYRRALEDAADAMPPGISYGAINWLRDRAAGVGTKDGADDE